MPTKRKTVRKPKAKRTRGVRRLTVGIGGALMLPGSMPYLRM